MSKRITITGAFLIIFLMGMTQSLFSKFTDRTSDSLAIVALYDSTNGDSWTDKTYWKTSEPIDNWYGITMVDGRISEINLSNNNLTGTVPPHIGSLANLTRLVLQSNSLTGPIPITIGNLSNLEDLYLNHNTFTDTIPNAIYDLTNLKILYLMNNYSINGTISPKIDNLTNLEQLAFESMSLEGPIPDELCSLTNLKTITMGNNQDISGTIPVDIGNLVNLTKFSVYNNSLEGPIPESMGSLVNLEKLVLANNSFSGEIPLLIGNLTKLTELQFSKNDFTGAVPDTLNSLTAVTYLALNHNAFDELNSLSGMSALNTLSIYNNKFTFEDIEPNIGVPATNFYYSPQDSTGSPMDISVPLGSGLAFNAKVGGANNLYQWYKDEILMDGENDTVLVFDPVVSGHKGIYFCEITNTIATGLILTSHLKKLTVLASPRKLDSLALVALYDNTNGASWTNHTNWLTAEPIDNWFGITVYEGRVNQVQLSQNNLVGLLPDEIGNLTAVTHFNVGKNHSISGGIPATIGNMTSLVYLQIYQNQFTGSIPADLGDLANLRELHAQSNQFSGPIPTEICNLSNIERIFLNNNQLTGPIPPNIGKLSKLDYLHLHNNQLTGSIPNSIGRLTVLYSFSLYSNQLEGAVPDSILFIPHLNQFVINWNKLDDLPDLSTLTDITRLWIENNKFTFEDIEPNLSVSGFVYAPQDSVGEKTDSTITEGDDIELSIEIGGTANQYQWMKDNADISGATDSTYSISSAALADSGSYICKITNSLATELTLYSYPANVVVNPATGIGDNPDFIPRSFALYQNYPNPFNPTTTIKYDLPKTSEVTVKIYNVFGQKVKTIVSGMQTAGRKNVIWNGRDETGSQVASGIYFYQINSASFNKTMKMILLK